MTVSRSGNAHDAYFAAYVQEFREELAKMEGRLEAEKSETWRYPARRTYREYAARQALYALDNFKHRLEDYELSLKPVDAEPMPHV